MIKILQITGLIFSVLAFLVMGMFAAWVIVQSVMMIFGWNIP